MKKRKIEFLAQAKLFEWAVTYQASAIIHNFEYLFWLFFLSQKGNRIIMSSDSVTLRRNNVCQTIINKLLEKG